ncbi:hypothetical protein L484_022510 [Morus notabilis]|uniref:Uncharacterized protein n=1 Tax=Morus notabilis TaxID=981085 RepID=W9QUG3_9ROSA|nr:hypothetical protein L484_022510 [Morus notabilis]
MERESGAHLARVRAASRCVAGLPTTNLGPPTHLFVGCSVVMVVAVLGVVVPLGRIGYGYVSGGYIS